MPAIRVSTQLFSAAPQLWAAAVEPKGLIRRGSDRSLYVLTPGPLRVGSQLEWALGNRFPVLHCRTEVKSLDVGRSFSAVGLDGSFSLWRHVRAVRPDGEGVSWLEDRIVYSPPGRLVSSWVDRRWVRDVLIDLVMLTHRAASRHLAANAMPSEGAWEPEAGLDFLSAPAGPSFEGRPPVRTAARP